MGLFAKDKNTQRVRLYRKYFTEDKVLVKVLKKVMSLTKDELTAVCYKTTDDTVNINVTAKEFAKLVKVCADSKHLEFRELGFTGSPESNTERQIR